MCREQTEVYSRIVGYYRPVQEWNPGKQAEFKNRKIYSLNQNEKTKSENKPEDGEIKRK